MSDTFEFTLNNPLTDEEWDMLTDVDFDKTERIEFQTKHGKHVEFVKVIRCKDCKHFDVDACDRFLEDTLSHWISAQPDGFCWAAERKDK